MLPYLRLVAKFSECFYGANKTDMSFIFSFITSHIYKRCYGVFISNVKC